jgi:hypothetical protein
MSHRPLSILVIGAGELGLAILEALAAHPAKPALSVLLRRGSSSIQSVAHLHPAIVHADLASPAAEIAEALRGFDVVVSATGFSSGPGTQRRLAEAALQAKVGRYIPWQWGGDYDAIGRGSAQPLFDEQLDVRDLLRGQDGVPWTIVSAGLFTSFLFSPDLGVVTFGEDGHSAEVHALGSWENGITLTTAEDIGRITAALLLDGEIPNGVVYIAGDATTFGGVAALLESKGWQVARRLSTLEQLERRLKDDGSNIGLRYQIIWANAIGVSWSVEDSWNGRKEIRGESLEKWVERNLPSPKQG